LPHLLEQRRLTKSSRAALPGGNNVGTVAVVDPGDICALYVHEVRVAFPRGGKRADELMFEVPRHERSRTELRDESGGQWTVTEESLRHERPAAKPSSFPRLPARRAFWFGWQAQFPDSELVK
jgi:hypothetical protein